jgi:ubiquinone/menaquinone biosynthesis C-methylase UbiE
VAESDQPGGIAGVFDRSARDYDQVGVDFFTTFGRRLVDAVAPALGEHVLDVGCGRGAVTFPAAEAVGSGGRVQAVDLSPTMVELTAAEARDRGLAHVVTEVMDAQEPSLADASYDVVLSSLVIFFLPDPGRALRAWRAAARESGRLGITTFTDDQDDRWGWLSDVFPDRTRRLRRDRDSPFSSDERLHALLTVAGWRDPASTSYEHTVVFDDPDHWIRWSWSHGMRAFWESVTGSEREETERRVRAELARMQGEGDGLLLRTWVRATTATA